MMLYGMEYVFVQVICPVVFPQSIHWRGRVRNREGFDAVQTLIS